MASVSAMNEPAPQLDSFDSTTPHPPPADSVSAIGAKVKKLSRKERRMNFWDPIHKKIRQKQESRKDNQTTCVERSTTGTPSSGPRDNAAGSGGVERSNRHCNDRRRINKGQAQPSANGWQGPLSFMNAQCASQPTHNPRIRQFGSGHEGHHLHVPGTPQTSLSVPPYHTLFAPLYSLHHPSSYGSQSFLHARNSGYFEQTKTESQSSATQLGDEACPLTALPPQVRALDDTLSHGTKPVKSSEEELEHTVMGIAPDTPSRPNVREFQLDQDLNLAIESPHLAAAIPDCASGDRVPRLHVYDWDAKTAVPEAKYAVVDPLTSSKALINALCTDGKVTLGSDRSWTWPGRETLPEKPYYSPGVFECGDTSDTLVDEPEELLPKAPLHEEGLHSADDSVESFLSARQGFSWEEFV